MHWGLALPFASFVLKPSNPFFRRAPHWADRLTTRLSERTYLELSEAEGSHKFYEVTVEGKDVTTRYGRIGTNGHSSTKTFADETAAEKDANKKIKSKKKKGYEDAVMGAREFRPITRRSVVSRASSAKQAPVLWKFNSGSSAFGIFVDKGSCWVGNQAGRVFRLDHEGSVVSEFLLPKGVKCLVADDVWLYAGCDDGNVYDLSGKVPLVAYKIRESVNIYWLDIAGGVLGVSDGGGDIHVFNHEDEDKWTKERPGYAAWMVRCDDKGVYHGNSQGVTRFGLNDGAAVWHEPTDGSVLFGWQERDLVFAGTSDHKVHVFSKDGDVKMVCQCDDAVYSCAAAADGKYVFAGDNMSSVYCFDSEGKRLWKLGTGCGSALSMQYLDERVYVVTTDGAMACIDASEKAIAEAEKGELPTSKNLKAPSSTSAAATTDTEIESTSDASSGVVVVCVPQGSRIRVRPESEGYNADWNIQFPKDIRKVGSKFVVDELREAGGFYRAYGNIKRLVET